MSDGDESLDLLFGTLALRMGLIRRETLDDAWDAMARDRSRSLGEVLVTMRALEPEDLTLVASMVARHLRKHGDDPSRTLAALGRPATTGDVPGTVAEIDPHATLLYTGPPASDPWATTPEVPAMTAAGASRYHVLRPHAKGGIGMVSVALDAELNREVALKVMQERYADDPNSRARFIQEAEVTCRLEHPGVVPIYGLEIDALGRPRYAMRFVRGESLQQAIDRFHHDHDPSRNGYDPGARTLALHKLLGRFVDVCETVAYAHSHGVIHRDLKPANILLGPHGETLVVDWGLAKVLGRDEPSHPPDPDTGADTHARGGATTGIILSPRATAGSSETMAGAVIGTPAYMSPEQAEGRPVAVGTASDIYSLGATLFCLLTGHPPVEGHGVESVLRGVRQVEATSRRAALRGVAAPLAAVCLKAMAHAPGDRYPSAQALAEDLERWMADEPVSAWGEPWPVRLRRRVARHRTAFSAAAAALLVAALATGIAVVELRVASARRVAERRSRAEGWVKTLETADIAEVPQVLKQMKPDRPWVDPLLLRRVADPTLGPRARLHLAMALVPIDPARVEDLYPPLLDAGPIRLSVLRDVLKDHGATLVPRLWATLDDPGADHQRRFNAACVLAAYDPPTSAATLARWTPHAGLIADGALAAVAANPGHYATLARTLEPLRHVLFDPLAVLFRDRDPSHATRRATAVNFLNDFADWPEELVELIQEADDDEFPGLVARLGAQGEPAIDLLNRAVEPPPAPAPDDLPARTAQARRRARAAAALVQLGHAGRVWPLMVQTPDPTLRTELIHDLAALDPEGRSARAVRERLAVEPDPSARRALVLALGEFPTDRTPTPERRVLTSRLLGWYRDDPDPGVHSAVDWLLRRRWGRGDDLDRIDKDLAGHPPAPGQGWYVNGQGQTMAIVRGPVEFTLTLASRMAGPRDDAQPHPMKIDRTFALATREVTMADWARFHRDRPRMAPFRKTNRSSPTADGPVLDLNWFEAAAYCRYLSEREKIPEAQMCYPPIPKILAAASSGSLVLPSDYLSRTGYRLPTEAEWEYACRAGSTTARPFGDIADRLPAYAWCAEDSEDHAHPVGLLKPNDLGLFDILGNAAEWCQNAGLLPAFGPPGRRLLDLEAPDPITAEIPRASRGASFYARAELLQPAYSYRNFSLPARRNNFIGLRPARTMP